MKQLATIKSVKLGRQYQRQDGTFGNIYAVTVECGDDTIIAETFVSKEGQAKRGIVPGAIGTVQLSFGVRPWTDKQGQEHETQDIRLTDFQLANQNIRTEAAQEAAPAADPAPQDPEATEGKVSDLPY